MPKAFVLTVILLAMAVVLLLLNRPAYVRELESRVISSGVIRLPDDGPSRKNALLSADMINGIIIKPGEVFSFNEIVGPRTVERGFAEGLSILQNGEGRPAFVRDVGGGICRTSTSLHQAVVEAGLEVKERHDHVIPVDYAEKGRDAALLYGKQDYKFKNTRDNPVKVVAVAEGDELRVSLEEKVQVKVGKQGIFNGGTLSYYRQRIKEACRSYF